MKSRFTSVTARQSRGAAGGNSTCAERRNCRNVRAWWHSSV